MSLFVSVSFSMFLGCQINEHTRLLCTQEYYMKFPSSEHGENMLCTEIAFDIQNNFCTQHVFPMFSKKKSFWQRFTCTAIVVNPPERKLIKRTSMSTALYAFPILSLIFWQMLPHWNQFCRFWRPDNYNRCNFKICLLFLLFY